MLLKLCVLATAALCSSSAALSGAGSSNNVIAARAIDNRGEHIMVAAAHKRMAHMNSNEALHKRAAKRAACPVRGSGGTSSSSSVDTASRPGLTADGQQQQQTSSTNAQTTSSSSPTVVVPPVKLPEQKPPTTQPPAPKPTTTTQAPPAPKPTKQDPPAPPQNNNGNGNNNGGGNGGARAFHGEQSGAILSWFRTNLGSDSTNGMSWCETRYRDDWSCFAPSVGTMRKAFGWDDRAAAKHFCGREAIVTDTKTGKSINTFICDGFDDRWVRTPASLDLTRGAFTQLFGRWTDNKNDVITGATWRLTGGVRSEGTFRSNGKTEG